MESSNFEERKSWFEARIGKRVWRNRNSCTCKSCETIWNEGLIILDQNHAYYIADMEAHSEYDSIQLKYFDTQEERDQFEKSQKKYSEDEVKELIIKALTHNDYKLCGSLVTLDSEIRTANFNVWFENNKK